jgi:hypothetical protein
VSVVDRAEKPSVEQLCGRCRISHVGSAFAVVSPRGVAHYAFDDGTTLCGKDATGPKWWRPR